MDGEDGQAKKGCGQESHGHSCTDIISELAKWTIKAVQQEAEADR